MRLDEIERNVQRRLQPTRAYPYGPWAASFAHLGLSEDQEGEGSVQYGYVSSCRQHQRQGEARLVAICHGLRRRARVGIVSQCRRSGTKVWRVESNPVARTPTSYTNRHLKNLAISEGHYVIG